MHVADDPRPSRAILLAIDSLHPRSGGPPVVAVWSALALAQRGHRVTILALAGPEDQAAVRVAWPELDARGVTVVYEVASGLRRAVLGSARRNRMRALVEAADVVHIHAVWEPALLALGRMARAAGVPYLVSVHGVFDRRAMERVKAKFVKKRVAMHLLGIYGFLDNASGVVFGSRAEAAESWMPSKRMRVAYVPNGAPAQLGRLEPTAAELERLQRVAPAQATWSRTLLCRSRIHPEKGIDLLIAAFDRVAADFPGTGLLIAGLRQDEPYEARLRDAIASSPARDRFVLTTELTGPASQFLYRVCDLFVMPSLAEGFSMALIEGLANARPLLITRYCHFPELEEAGAGLTVEPTVEALAVGLARLLALGVEEWRAMGLAARRLFEENYTWDHIAARLEAEYNAAIRQ
jgi:glycosyltransferase involved in cell wall biosynthesis